MFPGNSTQDEIYGGGRYSVDFSQLLSGQVPGVTSDGKDLFVRQSGEGITLTPLFLGASLFRTVDVVIGCGSKPQVGRVAAKPVVTGMTDEEPLPDGSIYEFENKAVGHVSLSIGEENSVPITGSWSSEFPAGAGLSGSDYGPDFLNRFSSHSAQGHYAHGGLAARGN